jgi:hypothetical protein
MKVSTNHIKAHISGVLCALHMMLLRYWFDYMIRSTNMLKKVKIYNKTTGMRHVEWVKETKEENCNQRASSQIAVLHVIKKSF